MSGSARDYRSPVTGHGSLPFDALLFDLGGVLIQIDFERVFARWALHARCDPAAIRRRFGHDLPYQRHERGEIDASAYFDCLRRSLDMAITDEQFADGWNQLFVGEMPGAAALLRRASERFPLYVFTNSNPSHQRVWSARFAELLAPFRRVFVSSDIGKRKPDPEAFRAVAAEIGAPPARILFFDDTPENVAGATASGVKAVHVSSFADLAGSVGELLEA